MNAKRHFSSDQAKVTHLEMLTESIKTGEWMAIICEIRDGKVEVCKTAWNFPSDAFEPALQKLRDLFAEEKVEKTDPPVPEPLEIGKPFFRPPISPERQEVIDRKIKSELVGENDERANYPSPPEGMRVVGGLSGEPLTVPRPLESDKGKIRLSPMGEPSDGEIGERIGPLDGVQGGDEKADEGGEDGRPVFEDLPPELRTAEEEKKPTGG